MSSSTYQIREELLSMKEVLEAVENVKKSALKVRQTPCIKRYFTYTHFPPFFSNMFFFVSTDVRKSYEPNTYAFSSNIFIVFQCFLMTINAICT